MRPLTVPPALTRRDALVTGFALLPGAVLAAAEPAHDVSRTQDFDELWRTLDERYAFFGEKHTDWSRVRAVYRPRATSAQSDQAFTEVVRQVLAELYDAHTHLTDSPTGSPRWPLYDLLAERHGSSVRIAAVQSGSAADEAGFEAGDIVSASGGAPMEAVVASLAPRCLTTPDTAADDYTVNVAVAGRRGQARDFTIVRGRSPPRRIAVPLRHVAPPPDIEHRRLEGGIGYVVIRSFADPATVAAFDAALASIADAPGLVIDVRDNGGGDTAVARPIMGRFTTETRAYARMRRREGRGLSDAWTEVVEPRGPFTFTKPVVVLTSPWSGSMAEGFPMGMRDIGAAKIVGTRMMGLGAAVLPMRLDRTGLQLQYSGEPVYDTNDQPRWRLRPDVEAAYGPATLAAGVSTLHAMMGSEPKPPRSAP